MGRATIVSGGAEGRYVVSLDYGQALKDAILDAMSLLLAAIDTNIAQQQTLIDSADALEAEQEALYRLAVDQFIAENQNFTHDSPRPNDSVVKLTLSRLRQLQIEHAPLRNRMSALKFERAAAIKRIAYWTQFSATETRPAWCADYTEDAAAGAVVATLDIPGESSLIVLAPGCRAATAADGVLTAREVMSPEQAYYNAAILPGWQKWLPTYRWGTITALDHDADRMAVALAAATSSAQRLSVDQSSTLDNVPADYMQTGTAVFEVGDRVVIGFTGQDWSAPRCLGFLDHPRPIGDWECRAADHHAASYSALFFGLRTGSELTSDAIWAMRSSLSADYRINRGAWESLDRHENAIGESLTFFLSGAWGSTPGFGYDVLFFSPDGFAGTLGAQMTFAAQNNFIAELISADDDLEIRLMNGSTLIFNAAFKVAPTAESCRVALIGRLRNDLIADYQAEQPLATIVTMRRLPYQLFERSGT